jgi:hypothetical protein
MLATRLGRELAAEFYANTQPDRAADDLAGAIAFLVISALRVRDVEETHGDFTLFRTHKDCLLPSRDVNSFGASFAWSSKHNRSVSKSTR